MGTSDPGPLGPSGVEDPSATDRLPGTAWPSTSLGRNGRGGTAGALAVALIALLGRPAAAGFPDCPECDEARDRMRRLGPAAATAALLGQDSMWAEERLVELGADAVPPLLAQFAGRRCLEPKLTGAQRTPAQEDAEYEASECARRTAKALAEVLGRAQPPLSSRVLGKVAAALDARLLSWLPFETLGYDALDALAPKALAVVGGQRDKTPLLAALAPLGARALPALPWARQALEGPPAAQVAALRFVAGLGTSAGTVWSTVAALTGAADASVADEAIRAARTVGTSAQVDELFATIVQRDASTGCAGGTSRVLEQWRGQSERRAATAALLLSACPYFLHAALWILYEHNELGLAHVPEILAALRDERRSIADRARVAELLVRRPWGPPLELAAADRALAERLLVKTRWHRPMPQAQQVIRWPEPSPWLDLGDVDVCRAEVGLSPLDGGWPIEGADVGVVARATSCLQARWCGPTKATYAKALTDCCAAFDGSVPDWCVAR